MELHYKSHQSEPSQSAPEPEMGTDWPGAPKLDETAQSTPIYLLSSPAVTKRFCTSV